MEQTIPRLNKTLVAFIDILGFKQRLYNVDSDEDLLKLYADFSSIHTIFEKKTKDSLAKDANKAVCKKVIAMSDALVISVGFESPVADIIGILDTLAAEMSEIALCQGLSVTEGIFLRGGLAVGYHFQNDAGDILLSSAMARAYDTERQVFYPLLALDDSFYKFFFEHPGNEVYIERISPNRTFFIDVENPEKGKTIHCLDYFHLTLEWCQDWYCQDDLTAYKIENDPEKRQKILDDSYMRNELRFVSAHKTAIQIELAKPYAPNIRAKYLWLRDYHNSSVEEHGYSKEWKIP